MKSYFKYVMLGTIFGLLLSCSNGSSTTSANNLPDEDNTQRIFSESQMAALVNMMSSSSENVGFAYMGTAGGLSGLMLPMSYYNTPAYWGEYVCKLPNNDCTVTDVFNSTDYTLTPKTSIGGDLQWERINVNNGTDIYDAATWQIAIALAAKNNIAGASYDLASNQNQSITLGYDGNAGTVVPNSNRANASDFIYGVNGATMPGEDLLPVQAYMYRMITRNWLSTDPFKAPSPYSKYITTETLPGGDYESGLITWGDWKPITGENGWALLVGPLQAAYLEYNGQVPYSIPEVRNAVGALYAISLMQSELGGIYYAPQGSLGNVGESAVNPYTVSIENNASVLAGLLMLRTILNDNLSANESGITPILNNLNAMLDGGTVNFYGKTQTTQGLIPFFHNYAFDDAHRTFYQEGHANDPAFESAWAPGVDANGELQTVDVNTWVVALLGVPAVDGWFGEGTAYHIWQEVKKFGGFYGPDNTLWGVGYSGADGNGYTGDDPVFNESGILSAEWTAGAINMVKVMAHQYAGNSQYVDSLNADAQSMTSGVMSLRTDNYLGSANEAFPDGPPNYKSLVGIPSDKLGFLYASKRYFIPFGWYANPLPSSCSTAWMIMLNYDFNPFTLGGSYDPVIQP
jgi:hypothetical protein